MSTNQGNLSSSNQEAIPPRKRKKHNNAAPEDQVREMWTRTFFWLANREKIMALSSALKTRLQQAGLGRKEICFN